MAVTLRHTAAFALVGWYLMVPPVKQSWSWSDDVQYWIERPWREFTIADNCVPDAPLSEWKQSGEYERLSECQKDQVKAPDETKQLIDGLDKEIPNAPSKEEKVEEQKEIRCAYHATCVATDDPRLKGP